MSESTVSSVKIQDELEEYIANVVTSGDDVTINGIIWLNADWSNIGTWSEWDDNQ